MRAASSFEHVERQLEAITFLGVDGQVDVGSCGRLDQLPQARQQFGEDALALRVFVAREQRAELHRDAVGAFGIARHAPAGDRPDAVEVGRQVAPRIGLGARALTEHVVAEAQLRRRLALVPGLSHRLLDVAAEHELMSEQLHRPHRGGDHGLRAEPPEQAALGVGLGQELLRQRDGAGRQAGQHLVRAAGAGVERCLAELVGGERDRRLDVGNAQQRLGQAHQRQSFGGGDRVLAKQRLHGPERGRVGRAPPAPRGAHAAPPTASRVRCPRGASGAAGARPPPRRDRGTAGGQRAMGSNSWRDVLRCRYI